MESKNNNNLEYLGHFIWWSLNDVKVRQEDLQKLLQESGMDYEVPEINKRSAFLKAVRTVSSQYKNKGLLIRKIKKEASSYVFGLVDENVSEQLESLAYSHNATMRFFPESGSLTCDHPHRAFDLIQNLYGEYREVLNSDDVRSIMLALLSRVYSVSVRQRGGIYFIPVKHSDFVEKMEKVFERLPGDCHLAVAPQIDAEKSKKAIHRALLDSLKVQMEGFEKDLEDGGLQRTHALAARLEEFKDLKAKVSYYADAMQFQADAVKAKLDELAKKVRAKLV